MTDQQAERLNRIWMDATGNRIPDYEGVRAVYEAGKVAGRREMDTELRAADKMAEIIDDMVQNCQLNARSRLADARLDYGEPYEYKHLHRTAEGVSDTREE